jgi:serine phosphatase RsbU (regulator of sigma subunit)
MVGDVSGHDATAAAMGAVLRATWNGLALAGVDPVETVHALDLAMREEQRRGGRGERFATLCTVYVDRREGRLRFILAGHQPPLLVSSAGVDVIASPPNPPLGVPWNGLRTSFDREIPEGDWSLLLYTDGLIEGRAAPGSQQRYGLERLAGLVAARGRSVLRPDDLDALLDDACEANGGPLGDDVVAFCLAPLPDGAGQ